MKHTYDIQGMTCNGCRNYIRQTLSKVVGVSSVSVDLEKAEASIEMESHIAIETFQKALQDKDISVIMLTGDNHDTAQGVAIELNLSDFKTGMLSEDKFKEVAKLQD
ncbi:MAG: cation transport ATPase [Planctomycetota bacterium]|jgi:cation transport ATPase